MFHTVFWYIQNILDYVVQMFPCMLLMDVMWLVCRPGQRKALEKRGLCSSRLRECTLLLFSLFCTGLAALTLFPHGLWNALLTGDDRWDTILSLYPSWEEIQTHVAFIPDNLKPFQEIRRILWGGEWIWFVLWGNIGMFMPIGFCSALLWRGGRWYRSAAIGFFSSVLIEFVQLFIGRVSDVDDVILNTTGALLGYWLYLLFRAVAPRLAERFQVSEKKG